MNIIRTAVAGLFALALGSAQVHAALIANSVADFSGVQGQDNWYYGYASGGVSSYDANAFNLMPTFQTGQPYSNSLGSGSIDVWRANTPESPWTILWSDGGHPTGTNNVPAVAVRRWLSEISGTVNMTGALADQHWGSSGDTGVDAGIFVDGLQVWSGAISSAGSLNYNFSVNLNSGARVDFVLGSSGNDFEDSTTFTARVNATVPEPSTMLLTGLALAGLGSIRRRQKRF